MIEWLIPIFYYFFCFVYGFYVLLKKQENGLVKVVIITFYPVIGVLLWFMLFQSKNNQPNANTMDTSEELLFLSSKGSINVEREMNIIPFQDALLSDDHNLKRRMLIDSLRTEMENYGVLNKAIKSDDFETAHYAATVMMENQRKFVITLQNLMIGLEKNPLDYEAMDRCSLTLKKYIDSGMIDKETKIQYQLQLSNLLEKLLKSPLRCKEYFVDKIHCDLETGDYENAQYYSQLFMEGYPMDEVAYLTAMKTFYVTENPEKLTETMNILRKRPVQFSPKGLMAIHFWT